MRTHFVFSDNPTPATIAAFQEGEKIAHDPNVPGYSSIEELKAALEA